MFYRTISFIVSLIGISISIFFFIEDRDDEAKIVLFFSLYAFFICFYFFKSLYYRKHKATFNELFFVVGLPLITVILAILGDIFDVNNLASFEIYFSATLGSDNQLLNLTFSSVLAIPFYLFSIYLLLRTFLRYKFIRFGPYSSGGLPATLFGIVLSIFIGAIFILVSLIIGDFLLLYFGITYAITGILGFFA